jgi:hypothetical protein
MKQHSETAWNIAGRYSNLLASETRDLAAAIDAALADQMEQIKKNSEPCGVCGCAVYRDLPTKVPR